MLGVAVGMVMQTVCWCVNPTLNSRLKSFKHYHSVCKHISCQTSDSIPWMSPNDHVDALTFQSRTIHRSKFEFVLRKFIRD